MRANTSWDKSYRSMQRALPKQNANLELDLTDKEESRYNVLMCRTRHMSIQEMINWKNDSLTMPVNTRLGLSNGGLDLGYLRVTKALESQCGLLYSVVAHFDTTLSFAAN